MSPPEPSPAARWLAIDPARVTGDMAARLREIVHGDLRKRGAVVGLSGGIDSSVCAALCVEALGADRVVGLLMPEADSAPETLELSRGVAESLGIEWILEDVTETLEAVGCYRRRDEAIRSVMPAYGPGWKSKIVLPGLEEGDRFSFFRVVAESPGGVRTEARLTASAYRGVVAATNFKQRTRKMLEYHHADRLDYAVIGTPNRLEYDQGFFVKLGDGAADVKPIAHLYKSQVYALAEQLGLPDEVRSRPPTTDTYSLAQGQDEFYFLLPYDKMDICLYAKVNGLSAEEAAAAADLDVAVAELVFRDIDRKRAATTYLHLPPLLLDDPGM